jgi:hypothetical protein
MKEMHQSPDNKRDVQFKKTSVIQKILNWVARGAEKEKKSCQA